MPKNGFGTSPFGVTSLGFYEPDKARAKNRTLTRSRDLDPNTKEPKLVNAAFVDLHPVDQQVLLILTTTRGSIPGVDIGTDLKSITHIDEQFTNNVTQSVTNALDNLIRQKKITLVSVDILPNSTHKIEVTYTNLIKGSEQRVQF